jgi:hypothetical protein
LHASSSLIVSPPLLDLLLRGVKRLLPAGHAAHHHWLLLVPSHTLEDTFCPLLRLQQRATNAINRIMQHRRRRVLENLPLQRVMRAQPVLGMENASPQRVPKSWAMEEDKMKEGKS